MARLGVSKKKKSPRATELSQLKKEVQRLTEQLESASESRADCNERGFCVSSLVLDRSAIGVGRCR